MSGTWDFGKLINQITGTSYYNTLRCNTINGNEPSRCGIEKQKVLVPENPNLKNFKLHWKINDSAVDWYIEHRVTENRELKKTQKPSIKLDKPIRCLQNKGFTIQNFKRISPEFFELLKDHNLKVGYGVYKPKLPSRYLTQKPSLSFYKFNSFGKSRHMRPGIDTAAPISFCCKNRACQKKYMSPTQLRQAGIVLDKCCVNAIDSKDSFSNEPFHTPKFKLEQPVEDEVLRAETSFVRCCGLIRSKNKYKKNIIYDDVENGKVNLFFEVNKYYDDSNNPGLSGKKKSKELDENKRNDKRKSYSVKGREKDKGKDYSKKDGKNKEEKERLERKSQTETKEKKRNERDSAKKEEKEILERKSQTETKEKKRSERDNEKKEEKERLERKSQTETKEKKRSERENEKKEEKERLQRKSQTETKDKKRSERDNEPKEKKAKKKEKEQKEGKSGERSNKKHKSDVRIKEKEKPKKHKEKKTKDKSYNRKEKNAHIYICKNSEFYQVLYKVQKNRKTKRKHTCQCSRSKSRNEKNTSDRKRRKSSASRSGSHTDVSNSPSDRSKKSSNSQKSDKSEKTKGTSKKSKESEDSTAGQTNKKQPKENRKSHSEKTKDTSKKSKGSEDNTSAQSNKRQPKENRKSDKSEKTKDTSKKSKGSEDNTAAQTNKRQPKIRDSNKPQEKHVKYEKKPHIVPNKRSKRPQPVKHEKEHPKRKRNAPCTMKTCAKTKNSRRTCKCKSRKSHHEASHRSRSDSGIKTSTNKKPKKSHSESSLSEPQKSKSRKSQRERTNSSDSESRRASKRTGSDSRRKSSITRKSQNVESQDSLSTDNTNRKSVHRKSKGSESDPGMLTSKGKHSRRSTSESQNTAYRKSDPKKIEDSRNDSATNLLKDKHSRKSTSESPKTNRKLSIGKSEPSGNDSKRQSKGLRGLNSKFIHSHSNSSKNPLKKMHILNKQYFIANNKAPLSVSDFGTTTPSSKMCKNNTSWFEKLNFKNKANYHELIDSTSSISASPCSSSTCSSRKSYRKLSETETSKYKCKQRSMNVHSESSLSIIEVSPSSPKMCNLRNMHYSDSKSSISDINTYRKNLSVNEKKNEHFRARSPEEKDHKSLSYRIKKLWASKKQNKSKKVKDSNSESQPYTSKSYPETRTSNKHKPKKLKKVSTTKNYKENEVMLIAQLFKNLCRSKKKGQQDKIKKQSGSGQTDYRQTAGVVITESSEESSDCSESGSEKSGKIHDSESDDNVLTNSKQNIQRICRECGNNRNEIIESSSFMKNEENKNKVVNALKKRYSKKKIGMSSGSSESENSIKTTDTSEGEHKRIAGGSAIETSNESSCDSESSNSTQSKNSSNTTNESEDGSYESMTDRSKQGNSYKAGSEKRDIGHNSNFTNSLNYSKPSKNTFMQKRAHDTSESDNCINHMQSSSSETVPKYDFLIRRSVNKQSNSKPLRDTSHLQHTFLLSDAHVPRIFVHSDSSS